MHLNLHRKSTWIKLYILSKIPSLKFIYSFIHSSPFYIKVYKIAKDLRFVPIGVTCDVLEEAMPRHLQRILKGHVEDMYDNLQNAEGTDIADPSLKYEKDEYTKATLINRVELKVRKPCTKYPTLESDESCKCLIGRLQWDQ